MRSLVSLAALALVVPAVRAHDHGRAAPQFAPVMPRADAPAGCFGAPQTFAAPAAPAGCFGYSAAPSRQVIQVPRRQQRVIEEEVLVPQRRQRVIEEEVIEEYEVEQPPPVVRKLPPRPVRFVEEDCCDDFSSFSSRSSRTSVSVDAFRSGHSRRGSRVAVNVGGRGILGKILGGRRGGSSRVSVRVRN
jgi:hypothetical protein